jgi:iduronate 2-sulfatase
MILFYACATLISAVVGEDVLQTNILMIMFDDLRPELKAFGREHMITPNFDRLAERSVLFDHAYTQIAVCNPSRDSILTGLRPDTTGTYAFQSSYHPHALLPEMMVSAGYNTAGFGKTLHWETSDKRMYILLSPMTIAPYFKCPLFYRILEF